MTGVVMGLALCGSPPAEASFFRFSWENEGATIEESTEFYPARLSPGQSVFFKRRLMVDTNSLPVEHVTYRMGVPYLPDFDGIISWTPLRCSDTEGCIPDPSLVSKVSFQGPVATRPVSFYTEADYRWDYSALGVWPAGFRIGDDFQLRATPQSRAGVYYLRFNVKFDVVRLPKFEGVKEYKPEHVILKRKGAVTPRIAITNVGEVPIAALAVRDEIFSGWTPPNNLQAVTVLVTDAYGSQWEMNKSNYAVRMDSENSLEVVIADFPRSSLGRHLEKGLSLHIKYPMNFDRTRDVQHLYSGRTFVTAVSPSGAFTKSTFTTGLIVKD